MVPNIWSNPPEKPWLTPQPEQQLQPSQWHPKSWPPSRARSAAQPCCGCPDRCALIWWESSQENHWAEVLHGVSSKLQNCDVVKLMLESPTNVLNKATTERGAAMSGVNPCYRSVVTTSCQNQAFLPSCKR
jgi:hypothetical protein